METKYRRAMKFVMLLLTSLLICAASVAAYTEMFMHGSNITIGTAGVKFVAGDDTATMGGGDAINPQGTEVTFDNLLSVEPGEVETYNEAVNITNNAGSTKTITVEFYSLSGNWSSNFDEINVTIIAANGTALGSTIRILSSGSNTTSTGSIPMNDGEEWAVKWVIKAKTDASNGQSITIVFKVKVE
jgi:hypothetical protein